MGKLSNEYDFCCCRSIKNEGKVEEIKEFLDKARIIFERSQTAWKEKKRLRRYSRCSKRRRSTERSNNVSELLFALRFRIGSPMRVSNSSENHLRDIKSWKRESFWVGSGFVDRNQREERKEYFWKAKFEKSHCWASQRVLLDGGGCSKSWHLRQTNVFWSYGEE